MEIRGKVHCLFEQSGTFKNEFHKLGYKAFDYDIQNEFGETDYVVDLFDEINKAYDGGGYTVFDDMTADDFLIAFFPCIYFTVIDKNRMERGDYFKKPTAYWFFNCEPTYGFSHQNDKKQKTITKCKSSPKAGLCSMKRSMISPDYARNWICDFVLGREQNLDLHLDFEETA